MSDTRKIFSTRLNKVDIAKLKMLSAMKEKSLNDTLNEAVRDILLKYKDELEEFAIKF